jgi:hypothetical protein
MQTIRVGEPDGRLRCAGVPREGKAGALRRRSRGGPVFMSARRHDRNEYDRDDNEADVVNRVPPRSAVSYWT